MMEEETKKDYEHYKSLFPITSSLSTLLRSNLSLSSDPENLLVEQDLLSNPENQSLWLSYIDSLKAQIDRDLKETVRGQQSMNRTSNVLLGNRLDSQLGRSSYQILVSVYERCLAYFPRSFSIWNDYLEMRHEFILGKPKKKFNHSLTKKRVSGSVLDFISKPDSELEDNERDMDGGGSWEGALDPVLGWSEWKALASAHERALMWLPMMPRLWLSYLTVLTHPSCPAPLSYTHTRHTFDRALRTLPHSLHERIWKPYLRWAEEVAGGETCIRVWRRYLAVDPSLTAHYVRFLICESESDARDDQMESEVEGLQQDEDEEEDEEEEDEDEGEDEENPKGEGQESKKKRAQQKHPHKALIAAKLLLGLVRKARKGKYKSPDGKSPYQLLIDFLELCEKFPQKIGISLNQAMKRRQKQAELAAKASKDQNSTTNGQDTNGTSAAAPFGGLIRMAGPPISNSPKRKNNTFEDRSKVLESPEAYDPDTDSSNPSKLDIDLIVELEGLSIYKDQLGLIYTNLATYWIKRAEFEKAKEVFETGIARVLTIRDFTTIFDAYAEFSEQYISTLMESIGEADEDEQNEQEAELDIKMKEFEELMDRRPFLVNDVLLRRNPNDVQEWEKRIVLHGNDDEKVVETYLRAIETINPKKSTSNFHQLFVNFAKFYEEAGSSDQDESFPDLKNARQVFERAVNVNFQRVDDLAEIWIEWAEMEVRNENYSEALRVMRRATTIPPNFKKKSISFHDESLPVQVRLFKSLKLWSFRLDLEESIGTIESTQKAYDSVFELKIANAQIVINYANFLEENEHWEESFKVYERGIELFSYPIVFEIWNTYLVKFIKRYKGSKIERARDLFEQALENCPEKFIKPIFLLYAEVEENYGLAKRSMNVLERATLKVSLDDRFDMFTYYIAKATENFGLPATRSIYQKAIESLPNEQTAEMCLRFASLEQKLGEIDRARAIYAHASQFCDPRTSTKFWETYHHFEIQHGSEDTFREMLRIKRAVQASFNTETSYLAAKAAAARAAGNKNRNGKDDQNDEGGKDPMSLLESGVDQDINNVSSKTLFVPSKERQIEKESIEKNDDLSDKKVNGNNDEINIDDDDDDDEEED